MDYYTLLRRKIDAIRNDPHQSRRIVYDLARYALKNKAFTRDPLLTSAEIDEQLIALEKAIARVEANAESKDAIRRRGRRLNSGEDENPAKNGSSSSSGDDFDVVRQPSRRSSSRRDLVVLPPREPVRHGRDVDFPEPYYPPPANPAPTVSAETAALIQLLANERKSATRRAISWFDGIFRLAIVAAIGLGVYAVWSGRISDVTRFLGPASPFTAPPAESVVAPAVPFLPPVESAKQEPSIPLPKIYGVYGLYNDRLISLEKIPTEQVDPRRPNVRQTTAPSRSVFPDGRVSFTIYQRDLANSAPITVPVRFAARIASTMRFGPGGTLVTVKPEVETWLIHTAGFDFRVLPVPDQSEMVLVRPEDPDFELPPGRYALIVGDEPYGFSVAGDVTDPRACVEGTVTNRGQVFYECREAERQQQSKSR